MRSSRSTLKSLRSKWVGKDGEEKQEKNTNNYAEGDFAGICAASICLYKENNCQFVVMYEKNEGTYCRAANIICALRSRKLASRFSAVSSHTARPPASSGGKGTPSEPDSRDSSP